MEVFLIKHSLVSTHYARFSFASSIFKPEVDPSNEEISGTSSGGNSLDCETVSFLFGLYVISRKILYFTIRLKQDSI